MLDLRCRSPRDIDQNITSQKMNQWFEAKTKGLNDLAKAQLKQRWGSMQKVLSSQSRLEKIVADIMLDLATRTTAWLMAGAMPCWSPAASSRPANAMSYSLRPALAYLRHSHQLQTIASRH